MRMSVTDNKKELPRLLRQIDTRLKAFLLQKLELWGREEPLPHRVRLYDLQCEGAEILFGFFKNKKQNIVLRAFDALLQHQRNYNCKVTHRTQLNSTARNTTIRTVPNTVRTPQASQRGQALQISQNYMTPNSTRPHPNLTFISDNTPARQTQSALGSHREPQGDLARLLNRVRQANYSQHDCSYSFREGRDIYHLARPVRMKTNPTEMGRKEGRVSDGDLLSRRDSRRQFIL